MNKGVTGRRTSPDTPFYCPFAHIPSNATTPHCHWDRGAQHNALLPDMTASLLERAWTPKVRGAENLINQVSPRSGVFFSAASAVLGP